ncbi:MAG: V-type ATP synthase subunit E [Enterococcus lemanii]|jgi:V/A-type H+-transporting ATPase subunit E
MADITKLTSKIINEAQKKQDNLVAEAKEELTQALQIKQQQLEKEKKQHLVRYEKELQRELSLKVSDLHVKMRNQVLAAKQGVLDDLFVEAKLELQQISAADFADFVLRKLTNLSLTGEVELIFGEYSSSLVTDDQFAQWSQALAEKITLKKSDQVIPNRSGVVFKQAEIEFNYLFEALLDAKEEALSYQLLDLIFDER